MPLGTGLALGLLPRSVQFSEVGEPSPVEGVKQFLLVGTILKSSDVHTGGNLQLHQIGSVDSPKVVLFVVLVLLVHVKKISGFSLVSTDFLDPTFADLCSLALGGERASDLVGNCADIEILPCLAIDVHRETNRLFVREFLREFLALEWVKCDHVSIVHEYIEPHLGRSVNIFCAVFRQKKITWFFRVGTNVAGGPLFA